MNTKTVNKKSFKLLPGKEKIKTLLEYATLAPSTHNTQPWIFSVAENSCKIYVNPSLYLREADRKGRYIAISLGCLIENLVIAAKHYGYYQDIEYNIALKNIKQYKKGDKFLIAEVFLENNGAKEENNELFDAIPKRFNARGPFEEKALPKPLKDQLCGIKKEIPEVDMTMVADKEKILEIARLTAKGMMAAHKNVNFRRELSGWVRNAFSRKRDGMSWKSMRIPAPFAGFISYMIRFFNMGPVLGKLNFKSVASAQAVCVFGSGENMFSWLQVGRAAEKVMLSTYAKGFNTSVYVAAIDIDSLRKNLKSIIDSESEPQFLLCLGYMDQKHPKTARKDIKEVIINE